MKRLPRNLKPGDLILIHWNDAYQKQSGWTGQETILKDGPCKCITSGMFIGQNQSKDVMIASSWDEDPMKIKLMNGISGRPLLMIEKIEILRKGKKTK